MLPILISLSLAPGSYFFWARTGVASATATAAIETSITRLIIASSLIGTALRGICKPLPARAASPGGEPAPQPAGETRRAGRHDVDQQNENQPVDRAGQSLGEMLGDVRHEQHE